MIHRFTLILLLGAGLASAAEDKVLFDFESGTWSGWRYEGPADKPTFGATPFKATGVVDKWRADRDFTGYHGDWMVIVGDTRHEGVKPGRLVSDEFEVSRPYLKFRFGAEAHPAVRICLEVDGGVVRTAYGNNSYDMRERGWDVRSLAGKKARLLIEDKADVPSLLRADYFRLSDEAPPELGIFDESEQESDILRYGEMRHLVSPPAGKFFSYAAVVRGPEGRWHLYAAQSDEADRYKPENQKTIVHATAEKLMGPWSVPSPVMTADSGQGEDFLWEPFVLVHERKFYMFYAGSGKPWKGWDKNNNWRQKDFGPGSTQGPFGIHLATSDDGVRWTRASKGPLFTDNPFAFTPFVMRHGGEWVMYYGGAEPATVMGQHAVLARTSKDLLTWGERRIVMRDVTTTTPWPEHSFFHDPFVFERGGEYYLLAGPINNDNQSRFHYRRLYRSKDPLHFDMRMDYKGIFAEGGPKLVREAGTDYVLHSGRYAGGVWAAPVHFRTPSNPAWAKRRILRPELEDRIRGGWAGQMIGVAYGNVTEFKSNGKINESELKWTPGMVSNALQQDDLYVEMTFAEVLDRHGLEATTEQFAEAFKNSKYKLWHANAAGRRNLLHGIEPRLAGSPKYNLHANDIDFQIEADFIGLMSPGLPRQASAIGERVGRLVNYGDGLYGGLFMSAMYAAAFFEDDPRRVVELGLEAIPVQSLYAQTIRDVLDWHKANPNDWRGAWKQLEAKWDKDDPCPKGALDAYNIDAKLNGAYVVLGLLYGGRDFAKTIEIATRAGQDSDCNPSTAGGIVGVMLGYSGIPEVWKSGIAAIADSKFSYTNYSFNTIVQSSVRQALAAIKHAGGREYTQLSLEIPYEAVQAPKLEQWNPGIPSELIQAQDKRWQWKGAWTDGERKTKVIQGAGETTLSFEGRGIALVGPFRADGGTAEVYLDGHPVASLDTTPAPNTSDIDLWHDTDLKPGRHELRVVTKGGALEIMRAIAYR